MAKQCSEMQDSVSLSLGGWVWQYELFAAYCQEGGESRSIFEDALRCVALRCHWTEPHRTKLRCAARQKHAASCRVRAVCRGCRAASQQPASTSCGVGACLHHTNTSGSEGLRSGLSGGLGSGSRLEGAASRRMRAASPLCLQPLPLNICLRKSSLGSAGALGCSGEL